MGEPGQVRKVADEVPRLVTVPAGSSKQPRWRTRPLGVWRSARTGSLSLWDCVHDRPLTTVGILIVILASTRPQVRNVVFDLPWPHQVQDGLLATLGLGLMVLFLIVAAALGAVLVVPTEIEPEVEGPAPEGKRRFWRVLTHLHLDIEQDADSARSLGPELSPRWARPLIFAGRLARRLADSYLRWDAVLRDRGSGWPRALGAFFVLAAAAWMVLPLFWARQTPVLALLLRQLLWALGLLGSGVWFLTGRGDSPSFARRMWGRTVFMLSFGLAGGEMAWQAPSWTNGLLSLRCYTIWGVTFLLFLIVAAGRLVDRQRRGWRLLVVAVVLVLSQWDAGFVVDTNPITGATAIIEETQEWFDRLEQRIGKGQPGQPVVLVAASGGGSRAAMFASLVFEYLNHVSFDGQMAARPRDAIANNVAAISSVSGGSLATAYYLRSLAAPPPPNVGEPRNFMATEVAASMARIANRYIDAAKNCHGDSTACNYLDEDEPIRQRRLEAFGRVANEVRHPAFLQEGAPVAPWLFTSRFVDDMATDFMAPLLRGVLTPFIERGHSVSDFWAETFGWHGLSQHGCDYEVVPGGSRDHLLCDWSRRRPPPLAMLNSTNVTTGRRVVIDFPPIPAGVLGSRMTDLNDHGGPHDLSLADAVRLSANFPWGFEVGLFRPSHDVLLTSSKRPTVGGTIKLTDGGVTDNSGLDTFATLIEQLEVVARPPVADAVPVPGTRQEFMARRARAIRDRLLERGTMLVEIDSGARPNATGLIGRLFPSVLDPLDALSLAGYGGALTMKAGHIARIRAALERMADQTDSEGGPVSDRTRLFYHLPFVCNHVDDVMTAWALGPEDKAKLMTLFLVEAESNRVALAAYQASLARLASESQAAQGLTSGASRSMARQLLAELRQVERERQRDEAETVLVDANLIAQVEKGDDLSDNAKVGKSTAAAPSGPAASATPTPTPTPSAVPPRSPPPSPSPPPAHAKPRPSPPSVPAISAGAGSTASPPAIPPSGQEHGRGDRDPSLSPPQAPSPLPPAATASSPSTSSPSLPPAREKSAATSRRAWVYLGHYDAQGGRWLTAYFRQPNPALPLPGPDGLGAGAPLEAVGPTNVRPAMPDQNANFRAVGSVLRARSRVTLAAGPIRWQDTGFVWAEIWY